ncbi:MAG: hypothetical protein SXA11_12890 [Cyanobacteriota bacterium]|nr:hypothetical protein [Cyanobacteriota bacterium]
MENITTPTKARGNFLRNDVANGSQEAIEFGSEGRYGYKVKPEYLETRQFLLEPISANTSLERHGVELLDLREELEAAGVTEDNCNISSREHRLAIGRVLIEAAERRFAPHIRAIHLADTSRVSGNSTYGEATVRDTDRESSHRNAHHVFHLDKFLPGIATLNGQEGALAGAENVVDAYWPHWKQDFASFGVTKEMAANYIHANAPGLLNVWVSLTPGQIKQEPLVVADKSSVALKCDAIDDASTVGVLNVNFPGLFETISLLRSRAVEEVRWLWHPNMRFGEAMLLSTTGTPHSAVWLADRSWSRRKSAEIRVLAIEQNRHSS